MGKQEGERGYKHTTYPEKNLVGRYHVVTSEHCVLRSIPKQQLTREHCQLRLMVIIICTLQLHRGIITHLILPHFQSLQIDGPKHLTHRAAQD